MSPGPLRIDVPPEAEGTRLDAFLTAAVAGQTRSALRRWILDGRVIVDGTPAAKAGFELRRGMRIVVDPPESPAESGGLQPESIPIDIVYEDEHLVVVAKQAGLVVHPGHGRSTGTLVHALLGRGIPLAPAGGANRPGIVHRLDAGTSGLLVVAKTDLAHRLLQQAFAGRQVRKVYRALVWGRPDPPKGRIESAIGRSRSDPTRMSTRVPRGRPSVSEYDTLETLPGFTLLKVRIETGRTHQIRVHLQSIHHPVVGDATYGGEQWRGVQDPAKRKALKEFRRPALHSSELAFTHPATGKRLTFRSKLPDDMEALLAVLRGERRR